MQSSNADESPEQGSPFVLGPVLNLDGLSQLLHRDRATIKADRCRAPERVPPAHKAPGAKEPLWILDEVLAWLRAHPDSPRTPSTAPRRPGRPRKVDQVRRLRANRQQSKNVARDL
jgi:hypothetical protein